MNSGRSTRSGNVVCSSRTKLVKASSLVSVLALIELTRVGQQIVGRITRPAEIYVAVGALYFVLNGAIASVSATAWRRLTVYR